MASLILGPNIATLVYSIPQILTRLSFVCRTLKQWSLIFVRKSNQEERTEKCKRIMAKELHENNNTGVIIECIFEIDTSSN